MDAGHGGNDLGSINGRRYEKNDNLRLVNAIGNILMNNGINVFYTRKSDTYVSPVTRVNVADEEGGDLYIAIHRGDSPIPNTLSGVRASIYENEAFTREAAENILNNLEKLGFNNMGIDIRKDLIILKETKMPAIMLEVGFIDSDYDNEIFDTRFSDVAQAIASGIMETFGTQQELTTSQTDNNPGENADKINREYHYRIQLGLFKDRNRAMEFQRLLYFQGYPASIEKQGNLFAVQAGDCTILDDAVEMERGFRNMGHKTLLIAVLTD